MVSLKGTTTIVQMKNNMNGHINEKGDTAENKDELSIACTSYVKMYFSKNHLGS